MDPLWRPPGPCSSSTSRRSPERGASFGSEVGKHLLGVVTFATIPVAQALWRLTGQRAFTERMFSNANLTIVGGLVLAAIAAELRYGPSGSK
jgi:hypothetical protein